MYNAYSAQRVFEQLRNLPFIIGIAALQEDKTATLEGNYVREPILLQLFIEA